MLGYVLAGGRGAADRVLAEVAARLVAAGWPLAGAVQVNRDHADPARAGHMDLEVLAGAGRVRISQDLGPLAQGCRLDTAALEAVVGLVEASMGRGPRLLLVNKFGRQEVAGRGFRPVIGQAIAAGVPVLTAVSRDHLDGFRTFAGDEGHALPPEAGAVLAWCRGMFG